MTFQAFRDHQPHLDFLTTGPSSGYLNNRIKKKWWWWELTVKTNFFRSYQNQSYLLPPTPRLLLAPCFADWPCTLPANSVSAEEQSVQPHQNAPKGFTTPDSVNQATQSTGTLPLSLKGRQPISINLSMERTFKVLLWGVVPKKGGWRWGWLLT